MSEESGNRPSFCTNCGNQIRSGSQFCVNCGANLIVNQETAESGSIPSEPSASEQFESSSPVGNTWKGTPRRLLSRFRDLPSIPKIILIGVPAILLLVLLSPVMRVLAVLALIVSVVMLATRSFQGRSVSLWGTSALVSLILVPVLGAASSSLYGGSTNFLGQGGAASDQYGFVDEESGTLYLPNGVTSVMPDGWTISTEETYGDDSVTLVPTAYGSISDDTVEVADQQAVIQISGGLNTACEISEPSVDEDSNMQELVAVGYSEMTFGSGTMAFDDVIIAGEDAQAYTDYSAFSNPWIYDYDSGSVYSPYLTSNYPRYSASVSLNVCSEELDLQANLFMSEDPFQTGESDEGSVEPTYDSNATLTSTRLEVRDKLRERYKDNIGAFLEILENAEDSDWRNQSDISEIPLTIEGIDEDLEDPFLGELDDSVE